MLLVQERILPKKKKKTMAFLLGVQDTVVKCTAALFFRTLDWLLKPWRVFAIHLPAFSGFSSFFANLPEIG